MSTNQSPRLCIPNKRYVPRNYTRKFKGTVGQCKLNPGLKAPAFKSFNLEVYAGSVGDGAQWDTVN